MDDDKLFKENINNNDISNNDIEKQIKEKLYLSLNDKENPNINTENYEMGISKEKDGENRINELIENHSKLLI